VAAGDIVPVPGAQFEETLASASPDMLRAMIREFAQRMMDADVEVRCGAEYGEVSPDRVNSEDGAGWLAFLRGLAARGLSGVQLVTSDDHAGLVHAIAAVLPGAAWQRCRRH
jgi:transposase-like protein